MEMRRTRLPLSPTLGPECYGTIKETRPDLELGSSMTAAFIQKAAKQNDRRMVYNLWLAILFFLS
jgi:hypothetical protein